MFVVCLRTKPHATLQALAFLHAAGLVHRDIKTANLFLSDEDSVKLGDFGYVLLFLDARCLLPRPLINTPSLNSVSRELEANSPLMVQRTCSTPVGTPMYMAPEICAGASYGQSADIWALGCVLCGKLWVFKLLVADTSTFVGMKCWLFAPPLLRTRCKHYRNG